MRDRTMHVKVTLINGSICSGAYSPEPTPPQDLQELWNSWKGKQVTLIATDDPLPEWTCGTDIIWYVEELTHPRLRGHLAVCRHMIEAGD